MTPGKTKVIVLTSLRPFQNLIILWRPFLAGRSSKPSAVPFRAASNSKITPKAAETAAERIDVKTSLMIAKGPLVRLLAVEKDIVRPVPSKCAYLDSRPEIQAIFEPYYGSYA